MQLPAYLIAYLLLATLVPASVRAQNTGGQTENVRFDHAQVLRVEPVYQLLRGTRTEERCDPAETVLEVKPGKLSKIVGAVAGTVKGKVGTKPAAFDGEVTKCRRVPVTREFRRPIAFDVDYVYRGEKYRSRLPVDPGNRLRVRISLTPVVSPIEPR